MAVLKFKVGDIVEFELSCDHNGEPRWDFDDDRGGNGEWIEGTVGGKDGHNGIYVDYCPGQPHCPSSPGQCSGLCYRWNWPNERYDDREGWLMLTESYVDDDEDVEESIIKEVVTPQFCDLWAPRKMIDVPMNLWVLRGGTLLQKYQQDIIEQYHICMKREEESFYRNNRLNWPICTIDNTTPAVMRSSREGAKGEERALVYIVCPTCEKKHSEDDVPF
jgi:hypothetical protein